MRNILIICLVIFGLFIGACKSTEKISAPKGAKLSESKLEKKLANASIPVDWLSCKGKLKFKDQDMSASGNFYMRIRKDSAIWVQIRKLGFEVGRMLITRDSFILVNSWEDTYVKDEIGKLSAWTGSDVKFDELQNLLWGLPMIYNKSAEVQAKDHYFIVQGEEPAINASFFYSVAAPFQLISGFLQKQTPQGGMQTLKFTNDDFQAITDDYYFPYIRNYEVTTPDSKMNIELSIQNLNINEAKNLHIRIPAHSEPLMD
jgi:hypothetical protein